MQGWTQCLALEDVGALKRAHHWLQLVLEEWVMTQGWLVPQVTLFVLVLLVLLVSASG